MARAALEFDRVSKKFGDFTAVKELSLQVDEGEIFAFLGPNGAGKSTSINMIVGLNRISQGNIRVFGYDTQKDSAITRRVIGVMHQEVVADGYMPVEEALHLHCGYYGVKVDLKWCHEILKRLALWDHRNKRSSQLSGGMKRRLMLAKALIHKPKLLILDEPTAGVDVELRIVLWEFVRELNEKEGTTVLLTTHYLEEAEKMCKRVAIINHGSLVAMDSMDCLLEKQGSKNLEAVFIELTREGQA